MGRIFTITPIVKLLQRRLHGRDFREKGARPRLRPRDLNVIPAHYLPQPIYLRDALREYQLKLRRVFGTRHRQRFIHCSSSPIRFFDRRFRHF